MLFILLGFAIFSLGIITFMQGKKKNIIYLFRCMALPIIIAFLLTVTGLCNNLVGYNDPILYEAIELTPFYETQSDNSDPIYLSIEIGKNNEFYFKSNQLITTVTNKNNIYSLKEDYNDILINTSECDAPSLEVYIEKPIVSFLSFGLLSEKYMYILNVPVNNISYKLQENFLVKQ